MSKSNILLKETTQSSRFAVRINSLSDLSKDEKQLLIFLLLYGVAWTICVGIFPLSMYRDSVEEVVWSQTWQWGYYKHPPLPSILLAGLNHLVGNPSMWLTIFAAQLCNLVALLYVWLLARQMLSPKLAIVAVLITSLIGYHNFRTAVYDHNTVSLPVTAAIWYYFYRAIHSPERYKTWIKLGIASGLAMLTKYSAILVLATVILYFLWQKIWRKPLAIRGLCVSILIFACVLTPHILWLIEHQWLPFTYLDNSLYKVSRLDALSEFFLGQFMRLWYMAIAVFWLYKRSPREQTQPKNHDPDTLFLLTILSVPLIVALLPLLLKSTFLSRNWVTAFFLPLGILIVKVFFQHHDEIQLLQRTRRLVFSIQSLVLVIFLSVIAIYPAYSGYAVRTNYPSQQLSQQAVEIWSQHQHKPLRIVIADTWLGGNVLLHAHPEPTVLLDNNLDIATWMQHDDVANCGALVLTTEADKNSPTYTALFAQTAIKGSFSLQHGHAPHTETLNYAWAILPPISPHSICRLNH